MNFDAIGTMPRPTLIELFASEPDRLSRLTMTQQGITFDFSKTHLSQDVIAGMLGALAEFDNARAALFEGQTVNPTEGRAAEHTAERGEGAGASVANARALQNRMRALVDAVEAGALGPVRHILHVGIGGSALGPKLIVDALGRRADRYEVAVVSNVDGLALEEVFATFDPAATLLVVASKTFTTTETMLNASSVISWMEEHGVADPLSRVVALTASPDRAVEWGVDETRILPFGETVGGRYSLWSSIGFPAALALGWSDFQALLDGAGAMDRHFRESPPLANAPVVAAMIDQYYAQVRACQTRAVFAYDERLRLLPSYLQQLEMESNGKGVTSDGQLLRVPSAPITWGGVGTDAQHAVFQLLHQGTHLVPVEFIGCIEAGDTLDPEHHRQLLVNAFAQGAALMAGRENADAARAYPGDRPSTTILLDRLDPASLGALIAFYEHRVFVNAVFLKINPFDQFGVELGKDMARQIDDPEARSAFDVSTRALMQLSGV